MRVVGGDACDASSRAKLPRPAHRARRPVATVYDRASPTPLAMADSLFQFFCPCCNKQIEVDTRSGKARAVRADEAKGGRNLDDLLKDQRREGDRLTDLFDAAKHQETRTGDRLDEQLRRAKDEAKKDKDTRPRNIFDLD